MLDRKLRLVGRAAHHVGLSTEPEVLRDLAGEIEWAKSSLISADDYPAAAANAHRETPAEAEQVAEVYRAYEQTKNSARLLDFDDLLLHTAASLEEHAAVAREFRDRYRCFVVDEYQDITPAQQRLLDAWLGGRDDLTVVGDANQTIYSFAGASPGPLLRFTRRFPEATVVRLERDYRSTPQVVALANRVMDGARDRPAGSRLRLLGQRRPGQEPSFAEFDDEPAEAAAVSRRIRELLKSGVAAGEIAVLFRVNAQSEVYEQALSEAGIPYLVRGGERFFDRDEVRQAMAALRTVAAASPEGELVDVVRAVLAGIGLTPEPPAGGTARERWGSLLALVELAEDMKSIPDDSGGLPLARFVTELEQRMEAQHPPKVDGVTLASLHAAKGLEWDAVFCVGLSEGTLPIQHADGNSAAIEEERRLLYVGITRAREHLWLSWALARQAGGRRHRRRSRFLHGLVPEDRPTAVAAKVSVTTREKARCRVCGAPLVGTLPVKLGRCGDCPSTVDEALLLRLREWRSERARTLNVPAYVVFTDATLIAIAERQPADPAALVTISGIGTTKMNRFGADVLALVQGETPSGFAE